MVLVVMIEFLGDPAADLLASKYSGTVLAGRASCDDSSVLYLCCPVE